jgi:hypothetical protein
MTIIFNNGTETLTVFPESVRGLRNQQGVWLLYVSDPEPMEVSAFRILPRTLREAAIDLDHGTNINREKPLTVANADWFMRWLLEQTNIRAELIAGDGQPAMFPLSRLAKPAPPLDRPAPHVVS